MKNVGTAKDKGAITFPCLRRFNGIMSGVHPVQAVLMMEMHNQDAPRTRWTSFTIGCFFGAVPWAVVLQYRKIGKWADYRNGERGYILLSLVARACWRGLFSSGPSSPRSAYLP